MKISSTMIMHRGLPLASKEDVGLGVTGGSLATFEGKGLSFGFVPVEAFAVVGADRWVGVVRAGCWSKRGREAPSSVLLLLDAWLEAAAERFAGTVGAAGLGGRGGWTPCWKAS